MSLHRRLAGVREAAAYNRFGERYQEAVRLADEGRLDEAVRILENLATNAHFGTDRRGAPDAGPAPAPAPMMEKQAGWLETCYSTAANRSPADNGPQRGKE